MFKKLFKKFRKTKDSENSSKKSKKKSSKKGKDEYENRFQKFYHLNKKRLNKERRGFYKTKSDKGVCVRCKKKSLKNIVFCSYHKARQKEYNAIAREKKKSSKKK